MGTSYQLLKHCTSPVPLSGVNEDKLCTIGFLINFHHGEAQARENAASADIKEEPDTAKHLEQFKRLKEAIIERHETMRELFSHVEDCFVCSVAFGLTPAVNDKPDHTSFLQLLARLTPAGWFSKMKTLQRI